MNLMEKVVEPSRGYWTISLNLVLMDFKTCPSSSIDPNRTLLAVFS